MQEEHVTGIEFASDARKRLFKGIKIAADCVSATLGPKGHAVIIQRQGKSPLVTRDGVTVARSLKLNDPVERMGAELITEAAGQTNDVAGDGTTTSTVLTASLIEGGLRLVEAGYSSLSVCRGIEAAATLIDAEVKRLAKQVISSDEVSQIGTISANGDKQIGDLIAQAMDKVGRDGVITVEDAKGMMTSLDVAEGMQVDRGYVSPYFVTDPERMRAVYENAQVLITDKKIVTFNELIKILEQCKRAQRPLLIVADDFEGEALSGLVLNRVKSQLPVVAIKAPGYGQHRHELLADMCVLVGATLVSSATGLTFDNVTFDKLGTCKRFITDAKSTTIVGSGSTMQAVQDHVAELRKQLEDVTLAQDDATKLRMRAARLASGVAIIKVGGTTEIEMNERKFRIEDALNATKAAIEEGIVPGGGMALFNAVRSVRAQLENVKSSADPNEFMGCNALLDACTSPLRRIVSNAGQTPGVIIAELERANSLAPIAIDGYGYNAATGEYCDLVTTGVIDPVKVTRTALKNAVSVAVTFLSLDAVVYDETPNKRNDDEEE
jgi:chaperonin GroEL